MSKFDIGKIVSKYYYDMKTANRISHFDIVEFAETMWNQFEQKDVFNDYQKELYITGLLMNLDKTITFDPDPDDPNYQVIPIYVWKTESGRISGFLKYSFPSIDKVMD